MFYYLVLSQVLYNRKVRGSGSEVILVSILSWSLKILLPISHETALNFLLGHSGVGALTKKSVN